MERKVKYTLDFKLHCVLKVLECYYSENSVARNYIIDQKSVNGWGRSFRYNGINGLLPKKYTNYYSNFKLKVIKTLEEENIKIKGISFL